MTHSKDAYSEFEKDEIIAELLGALKDAQQTIRKATDHIKRGGFSWAAITRVMERDTDNGVFKS